MKETCVRQHLHTRSLVGAGLFALTVITAAPAQAGCSWSEVFGAIKNIPGNAPAIAKCAGHFGDPAFWAVSGAVTAASAASSDVKNACSKVEDLDASASNYQKKAQGLQDFLSKLPVEELNELKNIPGLGDITSSAADAGLVLSFIACSCSLAEESGVPQLGEVAGECVGALLCWADDFFFDNPCSGIPPPKLVDCANAYTTQDGIFNSWNDATGSVACSGDFCFHTTDVGGPVRDYCYCPKPMVAKPIHTGEGFLYTSCECPEHTHRPDKGHADYSNPITARICLCDSTNEIVNPDGSCPPPCNCGCPNNQVILAKDFNTCQCKCGCPDGQTLVGGKCVTPCAGANQILLANGSCCLPEQVSSCGTCCPLRSKPDAATGSCVYAPEPPPVETQIPQHPKTP
jgi:hypothetical protein